MVPRKLDCSHHLSVFRAIVDYIERRDRVPFDAEDPVSSMLEVYVAVLTRARLSELDCTQSELADLDERFRAVTIDVGADWTPQFGLSDRVRVRVVVAACPSPRSTAQRGKAEPARPSDPGRPREPRSTGRSVLSEFE